MPFGDKMQKQHERALNGEMKKYKATGEAQSDTYSNKWAGDGSLVLIVQGPYLLPNDPTQKVVKHMGKIGNRQLNIQILHNIVFSTYQWDRPMFKSSILSLTIPKY